MNSEELIKMARAWLDGEMNPLDADVITQLADALEASEAATARQLLLATSREVKYNKLRIMLAKASSSERRLRQNSPSWPAGGEPLADALKKVEAERDAAFALAADSAESHVKAPGHCSGCDMALVIAADIRARRFFK